jgi:quercetin dioxygenase-like cupin family protein
MAVVNKTITNNKTGQSFRFIQTGDSSSGQVLEIESTFAPGSKEPPAHYHPHQTEDFLVMEGMINVRLGDKVNSFKAGESFHIAARQVHSMWNSSTSKTVLNWKTKPAFETEKLFETMVGLANDNRTNDVGRPGLLQAVATVNRFSKEYRLAKPSFFLQKIFFSCLLPFAYLSGKKPVYKKYLD